MIKRALPLLILLAGVASAWAIVAHRPPLESRPPASEPPLAKLIRAQPQTLRLDVLSQGVVTPRNEIDWIAEVAGKVTRLHPQFVGGGFFEEGELLLVIDPRDYDYAVSAAQARIAEARRQLAMEEAQAEQARSEWQALGEGQPSPLSLHEPQLAEARAKLKAAEADLTKARLERSRCELRAPFAGRVQAREVGLGQYVQPGAKLARLYSTDAAEVRLPVSADQLAYLDLGLRQRGDPGKLGPRVLFTGSIGGRPQRWDGRIVRSEGNVDQSTGLLHLVAEIPEPYSRRFEQPLLAGLFVKAQIEGRNQANLFALPPRALNASQQALLVDPDQRLHVRRLEVLRTEPERVLVKGGLSAGDRIVVSGIDVPVEGMKVRTEEGGGDGQTSQTEPR